MIGFERQLRAVSIALAERDDYTNGHCDRVVQLTGRLARRCGLSARETRLVTNSAKLHDVGKVGIPDQILLKPSSFEAQEWEVMKTHSELGQRICEAIPHPDAAHVAKIVRHHHERFDGSGYPDRLAGERIPIESRIISLVDAYDAMTTTRPYHKPRTHFETMQVLRQSATHFDPYVCGKFEALQEKMWRSKR